MKHFIPIIFIVILSCSQETSEGWIDEDRLMNREAKDWISLGGNYKQQHYSPLDQINLKNVKDLGFAWEFDARSPIGRVPRGLEATPFIVDGIMYTSGAWGFVYAIDAKTGKELWRYNPEVDASYARRACCDVVNRGVSVWRGKVYVGTLDGFLVCLDAQNGEQIWRVDTFTDRSKAYTITSPPQVAGNIVMIGNSGGEFGVRGYISAYDLNTAELKWRFFTVPGDPKKGFEHIELEMASKTWDENSYWEAGGGGTVWGQSTYDPELNLLYVGTGNSSPYPIWFRSPSGGDNLFLASILAINPDNGKLVWYYQTTPGEIWDYTATQNIILGELNIKGVQRKVLMQAPKNGFFYVLDRVTGELLSAEKYTRVNWASEINISTGRPVLTPQGQWYKDGPKLVIPGTPGGHNWKPMAFNPKTGLVYIPEMVFPQVFKTAQTYKWKPDKINVGLDESESFNFKSVLEQVEYASDTIVSLSLKAWNPVTQKMAWELKDNTFEGGILATPELIVHGTRAGFLNVFDAKTGEKVKSIFVGTGIMAAPVTYSVGGEQYIAVMAGDGGKGVASYSKEAVMHEYDNYGRILAFKLNGGETPLPPKRKPTPTPMPPDVEINEELALLGAVLYNEYCIHCHGGFGDEHTSQHPDLGKMTVGTHQIFNDILLKGVFEPLGMASFANSLNDDEVNAIHQYLILQQRCVYNESKNDYNNR